MEDFQRLCESTQEKYDMKHTMLSRDSKNHMKYLNRIVRQASLWIDVNGREACQDPSEGEVAMNDEFGKFVEVKWVRTNKGTAMDP